MRPQQTILILLSIKIASAASCGSTIITSQPDADILNNACPTVTGDVTLATNAAGDINFDGIETINGNLASENCNGNCSSLTSLSSSSLVSISQNMSLENLSGLTSLSFPKLEVVGAQYYLDNLLNLQSLSVHALSSVGHFHLGSAPKLFSMNLTGLHNVTGSEASIAVVNVGLENVDNLNVATNLSSFVMSDNPYMNGLALSTPEINYLEISGNMSAYISSASTFDGPRFISSIGTLNISGCYAFSASPSNTTIDNVILSQNTFSYVNLRSMKIRNNLTIVDNLNLGQALLPIDMSMPIISIRGNTALLNENNSADLTAGTGLWPWGIKNISSMILEGPFDSDFFESYENFTLIEVSQEFSVLSNNDPDFDCSFLNSLRKQGYFQGNYLCQGKTITAGKVQTIASSPKLPSSATVYSPLGFLSLGLIFNVAWLMV